MYHTCVITWHSIFTKWHFKHALITTSFNGLPKVCCSQPKRVSENNEITYILYLRRIQHLFFIATFKAESYHFWKRCTFTLHTAISLTCVYLYICLHKSKVYTINLGSVNVPTYITIRTRL